MSSRNNNHKYIRKYKSKSGKTVYVYNRAIKSGFVIASKNYNILTGRHRSLNSFYRSIKDAKQFVNNLQDIRYYKERKNKLVEKGKKILDGVIKNETGSKIRNPNS